MKLQDVIKQAVETRNAAAAGRLVDLMRFRFGCQYEDAYQWFHRLTSVSRPDFEALLYRADWEDANG